MSPDPRTPQLKSFLDREHFRFRRRPDARREGNEIELDAAWSCELDAPETPLTARLLNDFREFCAACLEIPLRSEPGDRRIVWRLKPGAIPPDDFDPQDAAVEAFTLRVAADRIEIVAEHERGLLHGTHRLEWLMADRGGPFLAPQETPFRPAFMPRISNGVFVPGHQSLLAPGDFSDAYLGLMSHFGVNGLLLYTDIASVWRSRTLPELDAADFEAQIASLRNLNRRTRAHGIDLYLNLVSPRLIESHAVFQAHPESRGARVELFLEGLSGRPWHNLCSGSETVLTAYEEAMENLFSAAPEVAGAAVILGGECFYHCFTRPAHSANGETNCPRCRGKSPSAEVARLANILTRAMKKTGAHKSLYAWSYSAWVWSAARDPHQLEWIKDLDPSVSVMTNFDGGDVAPLAGRDGAKCFDYNITCIGPSALFADQARALRKQGRTIFTKTETSTTPEAFFLPYLPVHLRWQARFEAMRRTGVAGFMGQWRFYGMNGSPPEELQYRVTWEEEAGGDRWLATLARREFALPEKEIPRIVEGWRRLSAAWEKFPYSAMTSGERAGYMRGPFYLGPAHPLIFDVQDNYQLPLSFRLLRGDIAELVDPAEWEKLQRQAKPRYVSDLLLSLPYGLDRYRELCAACVAAWEEGLALLRPLLAPGNDRARKELDVCETIGCHLATLHHVVEFYAARDRLQETKISARKFRESVAGLQEIAGREIANAERILPILARDPRIGYGYSYGMGYDTAMVQAKIAQCRYVRDVELPRFSSFTLFHIWLESP